MRALILLAVVAVAFANQNCGENAHFEECGTACPLTCDNYDNPPKFCVLSCNIGCHCDKGYVKAFDGSCVRPEECPSKAEPTCGENQRYTGCGSACPLTCDNYDNPPKICPAMCFIGCECETGYVKTRDGRCVRREDCPTYAEPTKYTCDEKPEGGRCLAYIPSWYYDSETGKCEKFIYGGCGGNGNRYRTEEDCLQNCRVSAAPTACLQEKVVGPCRAYIPRYFFNAETGKCEKFIYGGCGGNSNNFEKEEECRNVCAAQAAPQACLEEKVVGPCKAAFRRFYFDAQAGECKEFIYGGCNGNSNNFNSKEECHELCAA